MSFSDDFIPDFQSQFLEDLSLLMQNAESAYLSLVESASEPAIDASLSMLRELKSLSRAVSLSVVSEVAGHLEEATALLRGLPELKANPYWKRLIDHFLVLRRHLEGKTAPLNEEIESLKDFVNEVRGASSSQEAGSEQTNFYLVLTQGELCIAVPTEEIAEFTTYNWELPLSELEELFDEKVIKLESKSTTSEKVVLVSQAPVRKFLIHDLSQLEFRAFVDLPLGARIVSFR